MCSADKANWIEVRFEVAAELAEPIAEVLNCFAHQGVAIEKELPHIGRPTVEIVTVSGYFLADQDFPQLREKLEEAIWHLGQIQPIPNPTYKEIHDQDWIESWKQYYHPLPIGARLLIMPAWAETGESNRIPVRIKPGMAFGSGTHPSTQLCLELLEKTIRKGCKLIDIGCGSGILSIASIKMGASQTLALDIDSAALRSTQENAQLNETTAQMLIQRGSLKEIIAGKFAIQTADVVIANILAKVLEDMLEIGLAQTVVPQGTLILAGILNSQAGAIIRLATEKGLALTTIKKASDWVALAFQKQ